MVSAKDVQSLNTRIEKINTNRTKAKTQQEMLQQRLDEELEEYKRQYGIDLKKGSLNQTKALINEEIKKVTSAVEEEYELKEKVIKAIEIGDYETAYSLLGIKEEVVEETEETEETKEVVPKAVEEDKKVEVEVDLEDDFDMGDFDLSDSEEPTLEDDSEDIELGMEADISEPSKKQAPEGTSNIEDAFSGMEVEDDDLPGLDDEDFGFKEELLGSKFEV